MDYLDDFLCTMQSDEFEDEYSDYEDDEDVSSRADRRKNEWKHAKRRTKIYNRNFRLVSKPLHYYAKNAPQVKSTSKTTWRMHDLRQINDLKEQENER